MLNQIQQEMARIVGPTGVDLQWYDCDDGQRIVRVETAEAVWGMRPQRLLTLLKGLPDKAGILALRQAVDSHPDKVSLDDCSLLRQKSG
jgi:hypothetical protein